jgi:transcription-repair coupling factor (superfamily II helicase)
LGAGYSIAMRDLELRGAGDILGTRQHGHISAVGFHLYTRLLAEAVRRVKGQLEQDGDVLPKDPLHTAFLPATIELPIASVIPETYIEDRSLRLQLYRRMAQIRTMKQLQAMRKEMADRFGDFPPEVDNLFYQLEVRLWAAAAGVRAITVENGQFLLHIPQERPIRDVDSLEGGIRRSKRGLWLQRDPTRKWTERLLQVLHELTPNEAKSGRAYDSDGS